ncbi:hypothetical protein ACFOLD_01240 [Kocuria carniphila]|uniref:hypothetical protein n=1 Tax=Kocuria carniphila TaxID=262208 RepID=UPI003616D79F
MFCHASQSFTAVPVHDAAAYRAVTPSRSAAAAGCAASRWPTALEAPERRRRGTQPRT